MFRQLAILAVAVAAVCLASATPVEEDLEKAQKVMFQLAKVRFQPDKIDSEIREKGYGWDFEAELKRFEHDYQIVIKKFLARYKLGMLPHRRLFSVYNRHQLEETILVFDLFYRAPDLWTLIYTSVWASVHLNEYQFAYSLSVAMGHREDTRYIPTTQPFIFSPELFFNSDVMKQVYDHKISLHRDRPEIRENHTKIIEAKYTNWYASESLENEYKLAYYMEDPAMNAYYYYFNMRYPFWMSSKEYPLVPVGDHGTMYHYAHKTFYNLFYMQRLSHGMGHVELINWDKPIRTGYSPRMTYANGEHFPARPENSPVPDSKNEKLEQIKEYIFRISEAIDSGYIINTNGTRESIRNPQGFNTIGNIIQGNMDSVNRQHYGSIDILGRHLLGFSPESPNYHNILPGALEQTSTSMKDPGFYRLYRYISTLLERYNGHLGPYEPDELSCNGVTIKSASVVGGELYTYMEQYDTLIDKFTYSNNQLTATIKARQHRLNNLPFTYNFTVDSERENVKASFRIFIGPKYNVHGKDISENYKNFYELDFFVKDLKKGSNVITRESTDSPWFTGDWVHKENFEKLVEGDDNKLKYERELYGFPSRLMIGRGTDKGFPVQLFVHVCEFVATTFHKHERLLGGRDNKPLGYPLDRPIYDFSLPNMRFFEAKIFNKEESEINQTTQ